MNSPHTVEGQPPGPIDPLAPRSLPRVLGLFSATMVVVGSIIGSGIFLKVGNVDAALQAWGFGPIIGVWALVGLVTLAGSLAMGELAAMYPHAGGPYVYLREAFGKPVGFLWGWTEFWVVRTGSIGALASATVIYLDQVVPITRFQQASLASLIVIGLSAISLFSTRWGAAVQNVATVAKVAFLGLIITLPVLLGHANADNMTPLWQGNVSGDFLRGLGLAMVAVMWAYDGWINIGPVAEDIRNPERNLPLALIVGLSVIITVYVGANLGYHFVLSMPQIAETKTVAADVFQTMFGETGRNIAALGVMCSTFGATNSNMIVGPRIYLAIARDGLLPASIHRVHDVFETPANAILLQAAWTVSLIVLFYTWKDDPKAAFDGLTDSVICAGLIFYSLTVAAVYVLRRKHPHAARPYRTWGYPVTPALMIAAYLAVFVGMLLEQWQESVGVLGLIAAGIVYYALFNRRR